MNAEGGLDIDLLASRGITSLELDGEMDAYNSIEVRDMVMDSLVVHKHFIVDLSKVRSMDDVAAGTMISLAREVELVHGMLYFVNLHKNLRYLEKIGRFNRYCLPNRADALRKFGISYGGTDGWSTGFEVPDLEAKVGR